MNTMNERERFLATMHYQDRDRCPICDFGFWDETINEWHKQGLPDSVTGGHDTSTTDVFFGMDSYSMGCGGRVGLLPAFEHRVIEDRGDSEVIRDGDGALKLRQKYMGSIPQYLGHTLTDRQSWNKHFKHRLQPDDPARMPKDIERYRKIWNDPSPPRPRVVGCGSLYGKIRDWMGMENVSYIVYDDPALFEEMVTTLADVCVNVLNRLYEQGARFDAASFWEDMCYNAGPLLPPDMFKNVLVPNYQRITSILHKHGCDIVWVDCDGKIDDLLPLWLEAGVNCMFPVEVGVWKADPVKYRKQYGKELLMMGGFDKRILAKGKAEITAEVKRLTPLVEEGGFIPFCDHRVPPDVPLENYMHYLEQARAMWGKNAPSLKPMGTLDTVNSAG